MTGDLARRAAAAAVLALLLAACGTAPADGQPDAAARLACDDFAQGFEPGLTLDERAALAREVEKWAAKSSATRIPPAARALTRSVRQPAAWTVAADGFAVACYDSGWKATR
jgi:hypothetical protein